jgi:hypothetical protein
MDLSNSGIVGSNPVRGTNVCVFVCWLSYVHRGLAMGSFPVQGVVKNCLNGFIVSEIHSEGLVRETYYKNLSFVSYNLRLDLHCTTMKTCEF